MKLIRCDRCRKEEAMELNGLRWEPPEEFMYILGNDVCGACIDSFFGPIQAPPTEGPYR